MGELLRYQAFGLGAPTLTKVEGELALRHSPTFPSFSSTLGPPLGEFPLGDYGGTLVLVPCVPHRPLYSICAWYTPPMCRCKSGRGGEEPLPLRTYV
jgi:hypothetical protein